jgi:RNA polymerase sigma-70 factor (ECF subfamily)
VTDRTAGSDPAAADAPDAGPSDATLLRRHAAGDPDAFAELVRRHQRRLWAVALRTLGDPDEAADALQDALISAHRSAGGFRGDAQVTTWLHRIVVNACLDRARRRQARPTVPLPEDATIVDPADAIGRRELSVDLEAALARLPLEQRLAVVLVDVHGYHVDEVAAMLGVATGTVKSRCARGRARLAALLRPDLTGNPRSAERVEPSEAGAAVRDAQRDGKRDGREPFDGPDA